jgi:hypothetical protein
MTVSQMSPAIGKQVYYVDGSFRFTCLVKDVKMGYGNARFLISPVSGFGEKWVELSHLEPMRIEHPVTPTATVRQIPPVVQEKAVMWPLKNEVIKKSWWRA